MHHVPRLEREQREDESQQGESRNGVRDTRRPGEHHTDRKIETEVETMSTHVHGAIPHHPPCGVCGCVEVELDYFDGDVPLELGECPRCCHRWTRPLLAELGQVAHGAQVVHGESLPSVRELLADPLQHAA
jgi:hypothetical protein